MWQFVMNFGYQTYILEYSKLDNVQLGGKNSTSPDVKHWIEDMFCCFQLSKWPFVDEI